jgi:hypothetical protein
MQPSPEISSFWLTSAVAQLRLPVIRVSLACVFQQIFIEVFGQSHMYRILFGRDESIVFTVMRRLPWTHLRPLWHTDAHFDTPTPNLAHLRPYLQHKLKFSKHLRASRDFEGRRIRTSWMKWFCQGPRLPFSAERGLRAFWCVCQTHKHQCVTMACVLLKYAFPLHRLVPDAKARTRKYFPTCQTVKLKFPNEIARLPVLACHVAQRWA